MFNDSHEATRNVGMMGVVLAVLVLIGLYGLGAAFMTGMSMMEGKSESLEVSVERLEQDLKETQSLLGEEEVLGGKLQGYQDDLEKLGELENLRDLEDGAVLAAKSKAESAQEVFDAEVDEFEKYRDMYRDVERKRAEGEVVDLSASQGEGFEKCKIMGVSPLFVKVMTSTGPVGVDYKKLPAALQDRFQFGEQEATAYREWLKIQGERRDEQIEVFRKKQKEKRAKDVIEYRKREIETLQVNLQKMQNQVGQLEAEAKRWDAESIRFTNEANQARREGRSTSKFGLASQAKRKANGFRNRAKSVVGQMNTARKKVAKLMAEAAE